MFQSWNETLFSETNFILLVTRSSQFRQFSSWAQIIPGGTEQTQSCCFFKTNFKRERKEDELFTTLYAHQGVCAAINASQTSTARPQPGERERHIGFSLSSSNLKNVC